LDEEKPDPDRSKRCGGYPLEYDASEAWEDGRDLYSEVLPSNESNGVEASGASGANISSTPPVKYTGDGAGDGSFDGEPWLDWEPSHRGTSARDQ
jgi:hypothetical protein